MVFIITSKPLGAFTSDRTRLPDRVDIGRAGLGHGLGPHPEADKVASIGSFVVLSRCSVKSAHIFTNVSFSDELTDWK